MSNRNRQILGWVEIVVGVALLGYAAFTAVGMARGDLVAGPLRVITAVMNATGGGLLLALGVLTIRGRFGR